MDTEDLKKSLEITTSSERNVGISIIIILSVNAILSFFLIFIIIMRAQHLSPLFFLNVTMLLLTLVHSTVMNIFEGNLIFGFMNLPLYFVGIALNTAVKITIELILILRLRTLHPERYFLLAACGVVLALRAFLEIYSKWLFVLYGLQGSDAWMFTAEPFMAAGNIVFFSSVFILTLINKMYIPHTTRAFRGHRLFPFLVLSIENMIVPCITSITLAVYTLYVHGPLMLAYRALILFVHMGVTVVSIILTTVLGNSSRIRHHTLDQLDETRGGHRGRQLSVVPGIRVLMEAKNGELNNEFEFLNLRTEGRDNC